MRVPLPKNCKSWEELPAAKKLAILKDKADRDTSAEGTHLRRAITEDDKRRKSYESVRQKFAKYRASKTK